MKTLILAPERDALQYAGLDEALAEYSDVHCQWLPDSKFLNLSKFFDAVKPEHYKRVLIIGAMDQYAKQLGALSQIPNVSLYCSDAAQNFRRDSKYKGKLSKLAEAAPWVRVIVPGFEVKDKFEPLQVDVVSVPYPINLALFIPEKEERGTNCAFIGDTLNPDIRKRKEMLFAVKSHLKMQMFEPAPIDQLATQLQQIRFLVNSDYGLGQYEPINYQAMAAGCVLCTWSRGKEEDLAYGFKDFENVVLYETADELEQKVHYLQRHTADAAQIAKRGQTFIVEKHSVEVFVKALMEAIKPKLGEYRGLALGSFKRMFL